MRRLDGSELVRIELGQCSRQAPHPALDSSCADARPALVIEQMGWSSTFLIQSGLPTDAAYSLQLGQSALGLAGTFAAWFLMGRMGRRTLYLYGLMALVALLIIIGSLGTVKDKSKTGWGIGALLLVFTLIFDLTVSAATPCFSSRPMSDVR